MVHCVDLYCKNNSSRLNGKNITFHKFPKNEDLRAAWVKFVGRLNWSPTESSRLCSFHFKDDDFLQNKSIRILRKGSIPSVSATRLSNRHSSIKVPYACRVPDPDELQNLNQEFIIGPLNNGEANDNERVGKVGYPSPTVPLDVVLDSSGQLLLVPTSNESLNSTSSSSLSQTNNQTNYAISPVLPTNLTVSDETQKSLANKLKHIEYKCFKENERIKSLRKRLKYYQQSTRRLKVKLQKKDAILKDIIKKSKHLIHEKTMLDRVGFTKFIVQRQMDHLRRKENSKKEYSTELRTFCLELYDISHKAFNYVREKFDNCLPGIKTVQRWKRNCKGSYYDLTDSNESETEINSINRDKVNDVFSNDTVPHQTQINESLHPDKVSEDKSNLTNPNRFNKNYNSNLKNYSNTNHSIFENKNTKINSDDRQCLQLKNSEHTNKSSKIIIESGSVVKDSTNGKYHFEITNDNVMEVYEIVDVPEETVMDSQDLYNSREIDIEIELAQ